jgi:hypothetical protein
MNFLQLLSENPHEPNSSTFLSGVVVKTTYPIKSPKDFNQWVRYMSKIGVKWHHNKIQLKETNKITLTSK